MMAEEMSVFAREKQSIPAKIEAIKSDIEAGKENPKTYYELANLYLEMFDYNSAVVNYNAAVVKSYGPIIKRARFNSGWCYKIKGDYKNALRMFNSVPDSDKNLKPAADYQMSMVYAKMGDFDKAMQLISSTNNRKNIRLL